MASEFTECLNDCDISNIMAELDRLDSTGSTEQSDITTAVDEINRIVCTTARELNISATSGGSRFSGPKKPRARKNPHQQWYNQECEKKRKIYVKYKNNHMKLRNNTNLILLKQSDREYMKELDKAFRDYKHKLVNKIRALKSTNPREYWSIINGKSINTELNNPSLEVFYDYFKNLKFATSHQGDWF